MRKADNGHHRDRRRPSLFAVLGRIIKREKRRSILSATSGVAVDFEATAVRRETGKVGVAGAAGLAGLPGKARQSACRFRKLDHKNGSREQSRQGNQRQVKSANPGRRSRIPQAKLRSQPIGRDAG